MDASISLLISIANNHHSFFTTYPQVFLRKTVDLSLATLVNTQYDVCILSKGTICCVSNIINLTYETLIFQGLQAILTDLF